MNKIIIAVVVVAVIALGGYLLFRGVRQPAVPQTQTLNQQIPPESPTSESATPEEPDSQSSAEQAPVAEEKTITYTDSGYSPVALNIKMGETVTFENESSRSMWVASGVHPTHTLYDGTSLSEHCGHPTAATFDECGSAQPGQTWSFTFTKEGVWKYHNHRNSGDVGTITVE